MVTTIQYLPIIVFKNNIFMKKSILQVNIIL